MGAIYEPRPHGQDSIQQHFVILTVPANSLVAGVHDRMPLILNREAEGLWLDRQAGETELKDLFHPYDELEMRRVQVSRQVNNPRNDGEQLIAAA